jgi:PAS domain S-box-containing protein
MERPCILIIDDDPGLRKTLADIVRYRGFDTFTAGSGAEGLTLLREHPFSLAIIDLGLPDISGMEVLERVRTDFPLTTVIILTGNASLDTAIEATNRGAFSYVLKPYDLDQLMVNIRRAIEWQRTENALRVSEERFRKIFEEGPLGMALADREGRFVKVNEMLCRMLGCSAEELTSLTFADITHPDDKDRGLEDSLKLTRGEVPCCRTQKRYIRKGGDNLWVQLTISMIRDNLREPLYFLVMVEDITRRKRVEEERERLIDELQEALVRVKTLTGMLPICACCKKIRDDKGYWNQLETYISEHSEVLFSHGYCRDCLKKSYEELEALKKVMPPL